MRTLFRYSIRVTSPFKLEREDLIKETHNESIKEQIEYLIKTELSNHDITGLAVEVKELK